MYYRPQITVVATDDVRLVDKIVGAIAQFRNCTRHVIRFRGAWMLKIGGERSFIYVRLSSRNQECVRANKNASKTSSFVA
jgi:hypothetical protein